MPPVRIFESRNKMILSFVRCAPMQILLADIVSGILV